LCNHYLPTISLAGFSSTQPFKSVQLSAKYCTAVCLLHTLHTVVQLQSAESWPGPIAPAGQVSLHQLFGIIDASLLQAAG
jgi:hypothetical protein